MSKHDYAQSSHSEFFQARSSFSKETYRYKSNFIIINICSKTYSLKLKYII